MTNSPSLQESSSWHSEWMWRGEREGGMFICILIIYVRKILFLNRLNWFYLEYYAKLKFTWILKIMDWNIDQTSKNIMHNKYIKSETYCQPLIIILNDSFREILTNKCIANCLNFVTLQTFKPVCLFILTSVAIICYFRQTGNTGSNLVNRGKVGRKPKMHYCLCLIFSSDCVNCLYI